jgi:hypothetical protein
MIGIALYNRMKRKYEDQFLTTQILNDKIKKKLILKNDKKKRPKSTCVNIQNS